MGLCRGPEHAGIAVPGAGSLVRGEIPISLNLPVGSRFSIKVKASDGAVRRSCSGIIKRTYDRHLRRELALATKTPRGNACNWDSGLTSYAYGDRYGPGSTGPLGWHTVELTAMSA